MPEISAAGLTAMQELLVHRRVSQTRPAALYDRIYRLTGFHHAGDLMDEADALRLEDSERILSDNALARIALYLGRTDGQSSTSAEPPELLAQASSLPAPLAAAYTQGLRETYTMRQFVAKAPGQLRQLDTMGQSMAANPTTTNLGEAIKQLKAARRGAVGSIETASAVYLELAISKISEEIVLEEVRKAFAEDPQISSGEALARAHRALVAQAAATSDPETQQGCLAASQSPIGLTLSIEVQRGQQEAPTTERTPASGRRIA